MVAREFLTEFKEAQDVFQWEYSENDEIRGFLKQGDSRRSFDPLAAVLYGRTGRMPAGGDVASELGLSGADSAAIRDAADRRLWKRIDDQLVLDGYAEWLRSEMVAAAGLEPEDAQEAALAGKGRVSAGAPPSEAQPQCT